MTILILQTSVVLLLYVAPIRGEGDRDAWPVPELPKSGRIGTSSKAWWVKELTPDFYVAGRLTERQIKYAWETGFNSILSLFTHDNSGILGTNYLPTTKEVKKLTGSLGVGFEILLKEDEDWATVDAVRKLSVVLPTLRRPVLLYCDRGYAVTFLTLLYLANQTRHLKDYSPRVDSRTFFEKASTLGMDYTMDYTSRVVADVTGEPEVTDPFKPEVEPADWMDYWLVRPVYQNWYAAGQIVKSHLSVIERTGFKTVVNLRPGIQFHSAPSQEEVTLLNIRDQTGTYAGSDRGPRQSLERLEATRINPNLTTSYVSPRAPVNFEMLNAEEFGDETGYRADLEEAYFEDTTVTYLHMPIVPSLLTYWEFFEEHLEELMEAGKRGPVIVHSGGGTRAAYVATLAAAVQHGKSFKWAVKRSEELGIPVTNASTPDLYRTYKHWLSTEGQRPTKRGRKKDEL